MAGLHNRYPDYFYKSGNLFGAYLGGRNPVPTRDEQAEEWRLASKRRARRPPSKSVRASSAAESQPTPGPPLTPPLEARLDEPQGQLWDFLKAQMTVSDAAEWAVRIASHKRVQTPDVVRRSPWNFARVLIERHLSTEEATRYLEVLTERAETDKPLIRRR
jgi:hypothetical protein